MRAAAVAAAAALLPTSASAHLVSSRFGELYSGMLHPLTSLEHLVPWLALGLLGGLQSRSTARWVLLAFPVAVLAGLALQSLVPGLPGIAELNLAAFIVLGALVSLKLRLGTAAFVSLAAVVGISHGYGNAAPELRGTAWMLYAAGVGLVAYMLVTLVVGAAHAVAERRSWGVVALRAAGSWIAAAGAMYAGFLLLAS